MGTCCVENVRDLQNVDKSVLVSEIRKSPEEFYKILQQISVTDISKIYKVSKIASNETRIMKEYDLSKLFYNKPNEIINQIRKIRHLDHPNIIKIYESYILPLKIYLIEELTKKGNLAVKIINKTYEESEVAVIIKQILSTLLYSHSKGIFHHNLNFESIQLDEAPENLRFLIKISDFGKLDFYKKPERENVNDNNIDKKLFTDLHFVSPESFHERIRNNELVDVWSVGIMLFKLLSGNFPFHGLTEEMTIYKITSDEDVDQDSFNRINSYAKDLIMKMLQKDPEKRISLQDALNHNFFKKNHSKRPTIKSTRSNIYVSELKKYSFQYFDLQQITLKLIIQNLPNNKEMLELIKVFQLFDDNNDGEISLEELKNGMKKYLSSEKFEDIQKKFDLIDSDKSGMISYGEFVLAFITKENLLSDKNLKLAFGFFDKDNSGRITMKELKEIFLDSNIAEEIIKEFIQSDDSDLDGEINFLEFKKMMEKIFLSNLKAK